MHLIFFTAIYYNKIYLYENIAVYYFNPNSRKQLLKGVFVPSKISTLIKHTLEGCDGKSQPKDAAPIKNHLALFFSGFGVNRFVLVHC